MVKLNFSFNSHMRWGLYFAIFHVIAFFQTFISKTLSRYPIKLVVKTTFWPFIGFLSFYTFYSMQQKIKIIIWRRFARCFHFQNAFLCPKIWHNEWQYSFLPHPTRIYNLSSIFLTCLNGLLRRKLASNKRFCKLHISIIKSRWNEQLIG